MRLLCFTFVILLSGCASSTGAQRSAAPGWFDDQGGFLVLELEELPLPADGAWVREQQPHFAPFAGPGYLRATVDTRTQDKGVLTIKVRLAQAGDWRLRLRCRHDNPERVDLDNDLFLKIDDGPWLKFWSKNPGKGWEWSGRAHTLDKDHTEKTPIAGQLAAGEHTIVIAARSPNFRLDRLALFLADREQQATALETPAATARTSVASATP